jgi:thiamine-phosphate pyrophosphorylase
LIALPRLYAIIDPALLKDKSSATPRAFASGLVAGGVTLIQLRNKSGDVKEVLSQAHELRRIAPFGKVRLIMNDRADLCLGADFDGVHVGQEDLSPDGVRKVIGPQPWLGVSTHNPAQVAEADKTSADYIAVGPVFQTGSKANPDPVIGVAGVRLARRLTKKPLVAIGGITLENCGSVIEAGADSVAVISALLPDPRKRSKEFLRELG